MLNKDMSGNICFDEVAEEQVSALMLLMKQSKMNEELTALKWCHVYKGACNNIHLNYQL